MEENILNTSSAIWGLIGAALGSLVSYMGIKTQLKHQAEQSKVARELELRKQVYFEAIEGISQMQILLVSLVNLDIATYQLDYKITAALTKLHAVASLPLIIKLLECQSYYNQAFLELSAQRNSIEKKKHDADNKISKEIAQDIKGLVKKCCESQFIFSEMLAACLIHIRSELETPFSKEDAKQYEKSIKDAYKASHDHINQFIDNHARV